MRITTNASKIVAGVAIGATAFLSPILPSAYAAGASDAQPVAAAACPSIPAQADDRVLKVLRDVGNKRGINRKVRLAMYEAAWVESHANNLNCGDRDSLGVFQQRPSQGWGTPAQVQDPVYATNAFLDQAIPNDRNNPGFTAGQLAQSVQRSAYPNRYDEAKGKAQKLIERSKKL